MDIVSEVELWHKRARPAPTKTNFRVQLGCHFEEIAEMLDLLEFSSDGEQFEPYTHALGVMSDLAVALKQGGVTARIKDRDYHDYREAFLDSLADQIVTAVGVGHCAGMDVPQALDRVNVSNWSKFSDQGQPTFDANGKVTKGPNYRTPNLEGLY